MNGIAKLIKAKTISFSDALIRSYYLLGMSEVEAMVILLLDKYSSDFDSILSISKLHQVTSLSEEDLANVIFKLVQKGWVELLIDNKGVERYHLEQVYEHLGQIIESDGNRHQLHHLDRTKLLDTIITYIETTYNRTLSPNDLVIINKWLDDGFSEDEIKTAILDSLKAKKMHIKYADAILINRHQYRNKAKKVDIDPEIHQLLNGIYVKK